MRILPKRRRLENRTNYTKRRRLLEGRKPRVVVRKTNRYIILEYVESKNAQDTVKAYANSRSLLSLGWPVEKQGSLKSLGAAYLTGFLFGNKIKSFSPAIVDTGLIRNTKGSKIYAAVKGLIDSGFKINCSKDVFPEEKRIITDNLKPFFDKVKANASKGGKNEKAK